MSYDNKNYVISFYDSAFKKEFNLIFKNNKVKQVLRELNFNKNITIREIKEYEL